MKKALLIGATGAIGKAILQEIYKEYEVCVTSTSSKKLDLLSKEFPNIMPIVFDHTAKNEKELAQKIENIDALIIASGITSDSLALRLNDELWEKTLEINLNSVFRIIKNTYKKINKEGSIVLVSSVVARMGNIGQVAYAASKGGLEAMVKTLALEFAFKKITINCVAPGFIESNMTKNLDQEKIIKTIPLARMGTTQEVAQAIKFLLNAKYITGTTLAINGGLQMI